MRVRVPPPAYGVLQGLGLRLEAGQQLVAELLDVGPLYVVDDSLQVADDRLSATRADDHSDRQPSPRDRTCRRIHHRPAKAPRNWPAKKAAMVKGMNL